MLDIWSFAYSSLSGGGESTIGSELERKWNGVERNRFWLVRWFLYFDYSTCLFCWGWILSISFWLMLNIILFFWWLVWLGNIKWVFISFDGVKGTIRLCMVLFRGQEPVIWLMYASRVSQLSVWMSVMRNQWGGLKSYKWTHPLVEIHKPTRNHSLHALATAETK